MFGVQETSDNFFTDLFGNTIQCTNSMTEYFTANKSCSHTVRPDDTNLTAKTKKSLEVRMRECSTKQMCQLGNPCHCVLK